MRKTLCFLLALVAGAALAQVTLDTGVRTELTDCASGGSSSATLQPDTKYLMRVTDADVNLCFAATCAANGEKFPAGTVMLYQTGRNAGSTITISCRSSSSTGDVIFTRAL